MALWKKITGVFNRAPGRTRKRGYDVAKANRLTADWITAQLTANDEMRHSLKIVRDRSRDAERNNDWARRYFSMCECNLVGPSGIQFKSMVRDPNGVRDTIADAIIEKGWYEWAERYCTPNGMTLTQVLQMVARTMARDGEIIVRLHRGFRNPYGFAIDVIEADYCDEQLCALWSNGNRIINGVEIDNMGVPVAYHCQTSHPGDLSGVAQPTDKIRVPAADMLLVFRPERPGQLRGMPWLTSGLATLNMVKGYSEAALIMARVAACKGGFYEVPAGENYVGSDEDEKGPITDAEPGHFEVLPRGMTFKPYDPNHPSGEFGPFMKAQLRQFASGSGVSYNAFASDLEGVNMSSMRNGLNEERQFWMLGQVLLINQVCRPIFAAWLEMFLLSDKATSGKITLPYNKLGKFHADTWQARTWQSPDPLTDVQVDAMMVANKWKTNTEVINQRGGDIDDVISGLAEEQAKQEEAGLIPGVTASLNSPAPTTEPAPTGGNNASTAKP